MWIAFPAAVIFNLVITGTLVPAVTPHQLLFLLLSGFVGYFLGDIFLFQAFVSVGPRITMLIMSLAPVISTVISWFALHEKPILLHSSAIIAATVIIAWVVGEKKNGTDEKHNIKGYLFALGGAVGQGAGMVLSKIGMGDNIPASSANTIRAAAGLTAFIAFTVIHGRLGSDIKRFLADKKARLYVTTSTFVGPVLGVIFALYAIKTIYVGVALTLTSLAPVILLPVSHFLLNDRMTPRAVIGTIATLAAVSVFFFS